jgi:micrococcal nuclease
VTFSKPGWIVVIGLIICFILVGAFSETETKNVTTKNISSEKTEQEAKKTNEKQEDKKETEKLASDQKNTEEAEKLAAEQKVKELDKQEELAKQEAEKKQKEKAANLGLVAATVARVVDGDTFELTDGRKVRLIGVNTPESTTRTEPYGKEASNYTKSKLEGKQIYLQKDVSETDRYGRLLRIVWLQVPNDDMNEKEIRSKMFNADLVLNGYAEPSTYPPDVKYSDYFVKFAREAREKNKGLWSFGENGTTKGDLDPKEAATTPKNNTGNNSSSAPAPSSSGGSEYFQNCTELRKKYPDGVPSDHPAYASKHDRDKDGWACER